MRVELPDARAASRGRLGARRSSCSLGQAWMPVPEVVVALEDWGFDDEARAAWVRLGVFARRKAARRPIGARAPGTTCGETRRLPRAQFLNAASQRAPACETVPTSSCSERGRRSGVAFRSTCATCPRSSDRCRTRCAGTATGRAAVGRARGRARSRIPGLDAAVVERRAPRRNPARTRGVTRYGPRGWSPTAVRHRHTTSSTGTRTTAVRSTRSRDWSSSTAPARDRCSMSGAVPAHIWRGSPNVTSGPRGSSPAPG